MKSYENYLTIYLCGRRRKKLNMKLTMKLSRYTTMEEEEGGRKSDMQWQRRRNETKREERQE